MKPVETAAPVQTPPVTLADPLELACGVTLTNRLAKSAMSEQLGSRANDTTPELINLYRQWASGGPGLQVTGNVMVDRRSIGEPRGERPFVLVHAAQPTCDDDTPASVVAPVLR